nr:mucin-17-like [Procambarus clarkii]
MGVLTREMITFGLMDANKLVQTVVGIAPFPFPGLAELRDKYTYNITPWTQSVSSVAKRGLRLFYSDDDDEEDNDEDDQKIAVATAFGLSGIFRKNTEASRGPSPVSGGSAVSPSNFTPLNFPSPRHAHESRDTLRPNLDISALKKQYARLRERQKQAHIILTASQLRMSSTLGSGLSAAGAGHKSTTLTMNHLLRGKKALTSKTRRVVPQGVIPVTKPKKKAERKLSDSTGTRSSSQQQQPKQPSIQSFNSLHKSTQQLSNSSKAPAKVETLHWKDTPRRDRRASLPSGVKLLEGSMPCLGTLGVPSEIDDDDGGSSTSTELCDDDDDDKLSDLEVDPSTEPRPATTSPRLETVHEDGKVTPESKHAQAEGLPEDKKQQPVSHNLLPSVVQVKELQAEISTQTLPKEETIVDNATADQVKPLSEPQDKDSTKKIQEPEVPLATEPPLWDFKAIETGIPLEDLLAGKNLTAAEIIARIPFPSDVSFMQQTTEGPNKLNETRPVQGSSSPFSTQHNVTPERSPVDSPGPRITSPDIVYEPSLTTKPSPNISPSKSLSSTPSPRASPVHKSFISSSKSPNLSPSQSQDNLGLAKLSLVGLPPVSASDITHDTTLIPPKSPKITVEDEKRNIFEIYTGHPSPVTSTLPPSDEENKIEIYLNKVLENISIESDTCPDQIADHQENVVNGAGNVTVLPDYIKLNEAKDTETSVVESNDLENKFEDTWDTKTLLENPKEFTWLKDSYKQCESESNGSLINASFSIETSSPTPDSTVFEAICQRLKENVIKTESDIPEVQTNFATNSGFLCLTINKEDNTLHSETQTATSIDKLDASVEDVKTSGCTSPVTNTPTEALGTSSWLSSFTMTVNSSLIPLATSDSNLVAPLCKPSEAGYEIIEAALNKEVSPVTVSFESSTSPVITTSEAGSTSVFTTVDSGFSIFMKTYSSTSDIVSDDDTSLKTEIVGNLASSVTTTFNNGITHTAVSSSHSPTSFNTRVSPGTDTSEFMFPCMLSRFSEFTKEFDSGNAAKKINEDLYSLENTDTSNYSSTLENLHIVGTWKNDKSSIVTSAIDEFPVVTTSNSCQIISTSRSETRVPSPLATEPECSSIMETSLVSSPPLYVINTLPDIPLAFSIPTGEITYSSINVSQETSSPNDMSNEKSLKTSVNDTSLDYDPSLENEILSLIGKNQTFSESTAEKCDSSETTNSHRQTKLESSASPALSLEERILALLNIDEKMSTVSPDGTLLSHRSSSVDGSKLPTTESGERHVSSMENSENMYASLITTKEEILSPVPSLDRESSLSASLEGRISFFTNNLKDERDDETGAYARLTEDKEDRSSDDNDAEAETDFFNGKDLSSEAIRQRLWSGVKSLSLDADITLDPNVFCFLIQQSSRQKKWKDDRKLPRRRNSEVALQELVKENTEIIERILKQKSVEGSGFIKIETPIHTPLEETKTPVHTALKEDKTPVNSALDETKTPVHTALEDTKTPVHTAVEETKTPVHTAVEETKTPVHTALEETKTPIHTVFEETKTPVHTAIEETKTPVHTALEETKTAVHSTLEETKTPVHTAIEETKTVEKESENKLRETSASIKFNMENSESDCSINSRSHKETKSLSGEACVAATFESLEGATNFVKVKEFSHSTTQSKVISPQSSKTSLPEWKYNNKREDGSIALSPTRPITFNPFPTRNVPRQPKEVGVKLGLYSPTKKMSGSSTS